MALTPGTRLGPYEITAKIGEGGMGEVYRARDSQLKRDVAVKVLPASVAADPSRLARFQREAKVLAALNHPHIAAIYGFQAFEGRAALVMEYVEGDDLSRRIARGPMPLDEALPIARQIADALETAHEQSIIHRDLKPANIKVRPDGTVKVLDFGLAKALAPDGSSAAADAMNSPTLTSPAMTQAGMILGTAAYMAPEQARGRIVDRRADIWAFGAVLFEMLTGRRAFHGDDITDTIVSVVSKEPDWSALPPMPEGVRRLLARCLKKDPKARLRDIGDARVQIDELISGVVDESAAGSGISAATSVAPPRSTMWRAVALTLAVSTLALAIAVVMLWSRRSAQEAPPQWQFTRKTFAAQAVFVARFMPDGETIVFSAAPSGNTPQLFELRPNTSIPRAFGPPGTHLLSVSRSGELAVLTNAKFIMQGALSGTLSRMTMDGAPRAIAEDVRDADWLPKETDLAVVREVAGGDQLEFPIGLVVHRTTGYLTDLRVSPDGMRVAFMEHPVKFDDRGWVKVVDRAGLVTTLAGEYSGERGVAWAADGRTVYFSPTGRGILSVPAAGGSTTRMLTSAGGAVIHDAVSDGRLLISREDLKGEVAARGAGQPAARDLATTSSEWGISLSPDGRLAAFTQAGGIDYRVLMRTVEGGPPAHLGPGNASAFSPDGLWLTATLFSTGRCVVYPTGSGKEVPIPMGPLESCTTAGWFPGGKQLIIVGKEPGKPIRTYRSAFPGGTPQRLLPENLEAQGLQSSGGCLLARDPTGAWQRFDDTGPTTTVKGLGLKDNLLHCAADGRTVFVGDDAALPAVVYRVDLGSGERRKVADVAPADRVGLLRVILTHYRDNGQLAYQYLRGISTVFVATPEK